MCFFFFDDRMVCDGACQHKPLNALPLTKPDGPLAPLHNCISPPTLIPEELSDPLRRGRPRPPSAARSPRAEHQNRLAAGTGNKGAPGTKNVPEREKKKKLPATTFIYSVQIYLTRVYF